MNVRLTVFSENELILSLVGDFGRGLGCRVDAAPAASARALRTELPDGGDMLLELLDHVALSAAKAGVDAAEPLCRVNVPAPRRVSGGHARPAGRRVQSRPDEFGRRLTCLRAG